VPHMESKIRIKWSRNGVSYGRILPYYSAMGVKETMNFLRNLYPQYIVYDDFRSIELVEVPRNMVKRHYKPEERVKEILGSPRDSVEELARELILKISSEAKIDLDFMGITGSILLGIHNPTYSDIDLIVYGFSNAVKVRETLKKLYDEDSDFSLPKGKILEDWANDIIKIHPLTFKEALLLYSRYKWNRALYRGRQFSVHPVKLENEFSEVWEENVCKPIGMITVKARVADSTDSIFIPAAYMVEDVKVIEGVKPSKPIVKVLSYEGLYMDLADAGEEIVVRGKLEEVRNLKSGEEYCQIVVGTFEAVGEDYLKPIKWFKNL
ncbi:MAG: hypothetical protein QXI93_04475, partial [Candidatus Methanomethylicia archaeon]